MKVHLEEPPGNSALKDQIARNLSCAVELPKLAFVLLQCFKISYAVWDPVLESMGQVER